MKISPYQVVSADTWKSITEDNHIDKLIANNLIPKNAKNKLYDLPDHITKNTKIVGSVTIGDDGLPLIMWMTMDEYNKIINK